MNNSEIIKAYKKKRVFKARPSVFKTLAIRSPFPFPKVDNYPTINDPVPPLVAQSWDIHNAKEGTIKEPTQGRILVHRNRMHFIMDFTPMIRETLEETPKQIEEEIQEPEPVLIKCTECFQSCEIPDWLCINFEVAKRTKCHVRQGAMVCYRCYLAVRFQCQLQAYHDTLCPACSDYDPHTPMELCYECWPIFQRFMNAVELLDKNPLSETWFSKIQEINHIIPAVPSGWTAIEIRIGDELKDCHWSCVCDPDRTSKIITMFGSFPINEVVDI